MFSKKQILITSLLFALLFHFVFYFNAYGPGIGFLHNKFQYVFALASLILILFIYFGTYWRLDFIDKVSLRLYDLFIVWMFICFTRSLIEFRSSKEFLNFIANNYMGISLFPVFFLIAGISPKYFHITNKLLFIYLVSVTLVSIFFLDYFELQIFLLYPIFYVIVTIPLRSGWQKLVILLIAVLIVVVSVTNRSGILRIFIGFSVVIAYYVIKYVKVNKILLNVIVFCVLLIPFGSLYLGIKGQSVFQMMSGDDDRQYSQLDPYADTRTFLYYEVFQDLKHNDAFLLGKGLNAGYMSEAFETYNRPVVEVAFLQILLKTGIVGFLLYISIIISAIFKALSSSKNVFLKSLGLLLASYLIMIFIENQIAYNLLNVITWIVVGMCHSKALRELNDKEIYDLFRKPYIVESKRSANQRL